MTIRRDYVRTGTRRSARWGTLALGFGTAALLATVTVCGEGAALAGSGELASAREDVVQADHAAALLAAVRGANPLVCRLASRALENRWGGRSQVPGPESIGEAGDSVFHWAVSAPITPALVTPLRAALADPDACVRRTAAGLLGRVNTGGLAAALSAELGSASAETRAAALIAIGHAGRAGDVSAAIRALSDDAPAVKLAAVWAAGEIGAPEAAPALAPLLRDADPLVRANAAYALGEIESAESIPALARLLADDSDARVRIAAAAALGQFDD